jgi:hypothetical protein
MYALPALLCTLLPLSSSVGPAPAHVDKPTAGQNAAAQAIGGGGRYSLQTQLHAAPHGLTAARYSLQARVEASGPRLLLAAACSDGDALFANGFETVVVRASRSALR